MSSCTVCGRSELSLKACGNCKEILYCSTACQRVHWKEHKNSCVKKVEYKQDECARLEKTSEASGSLLFKYVQRVGGGGGGMVAAQHIPPGMIVTKDSPLMKVTGEELGVSDVCSKDGDITAKYDKRHAIVKKHFDQLSAQDQSAVLELEDTQTNNKLVRAMVDRFYKDGEIKVPWSTLYSSTSVQADTVVPEIQDGAGFKSPEGVFATNCLPVGYREELGLFPIISRFNHSCVNNAVYRWSDAHNSQVVMATRDIECGEEICVSYFECKFQQRSQRQHRTVMSWGFKCQCDACAMPGFDLAGTLDTSKMTDAELDAIPADQWTQIEASAISDQNRVRLGKLDTTLNTASSLQIVERICTEMRTLYHKENITPNLKLEQQLAQDLFQAHVGFGGPHGVKWCQELYNITKLMEGELHDDTKTLKMWMKRLPNIADVIQFVNQGAQRQD